MHIEDWRSQIKRGTDDMKLGALRITTFFNIAVLFVGVAFALLIAFDLITFSRNGEKCLLWHLFPV